MKTINFSYLLFFQLGLLHSTIKLIYIPIPISMKLVMSISCCTPGLSLIDKVPTPPTNLAFYFNRIRESKDQVNFPYEKELTKSKQILDNQTKIFFPDEILCSKKDCNLYQDGVLFYYDSGHLSPEGAKLLKNSIENYLLEPN